MTSVASNSAQVNIAVAFILQSKWHKFNEGYDVHYCVFLLLSTVGTTYHVWYHAGFLRIYHCFNSLLQRLTL